MPEMNPDIVRVFVIPKGQSVLGCYNLRFQDYPPFDGAVMLNIISSHERPPEHYVHGSTLKEDAPEYHTEIDPRYELERIQSALEGTAWTGQVAVIHYTAVWSRFGDETEISILEVEA